MLRNNRSEKRPPNILNRYLQGGYFKHTGKSIRPPNIYPGFIADFQDQDLWSVYSLANRNKRFWSLGKRNRGLTSSSSVHKMYNRQQRGTTRKIAKLVCS